MRSLTAWRPWLPATLGLLLIGCAAVPPGERGLAPERKAAVPRVPPAAQGNPAVAALLATAHDQIQAGDFDQAGASLERALRLEPRNAMLWHRLAQVRLGQGKWREAIDLAAKSNSLAGGKHELQASNWLVVAQAKQRQGDREGAEAARAHMAGSGAINFPDLELDSGNR